MRSSLRPSLFACLSGGRDAAPFGPGRWLSRLAAVLLLIALLPVGVWAQVSVLGAAATTTETSGSQFSKTMAISAPAGSNRLLVVTSGGGGNFASPVSVTFNGTPMTQGAAPATGSSVRNGIWYLPLGTSGTVTTGNVVVTYNSSFFFDVTALTLQGVDQTTPVSSAPTGTAATLAVTSVVGDMVVDAIVGSGAGVAVVAGQTLAAANNNLVFAADPDTGTSTKAGAASVSMGWTGFTAVTSHVAINVRQVTAPISITTATLINANVGTNYLDVVNATGGLGTKTFTVTAGSLPPGLVLATSGTVSGSPTTPGTYNFTVTATDTVSATGTKAFAIVISGPPTVTTPTSASIATTTATLGGNVTAENGATTQSRGVVYALTATNANPQFGGTGVTSATTTGTTGVFTVNVTGLTAGAAYSFKAYATNSTGIGYTAVGTFTTAAAVPLTVNPAALPNGTLGSAYTQPITASGGTGAITFAVTAGALPAGLTLTAAGALSGTPTAAGTSNFTVTATDAAAATGTRAYTLVIGPAAPLAITTTTLPNAVVGVAGYSQAIVATGGAGTTTFAILDGGLPPGLAITLGGTINGTATTAGTYNFTVSVIDSVATIVSRAFTIVVTTPSTLAISTTTLASATVNAAGYSQPLAVTGAAGATTFSVTSGALPPGLLLSSTGTISGTATTTGLFTFTVTATDAAANTATRALSIAVGAPVALAITTTTLPNAALNTAGYSATITATGGTGTTTFGLTNGALPPGLTLTLAGTISGTATTSGTYNFTISAIDTAATVVSRAFTIVVAAVGVTPQTITFAALATKAVGDAPFTLTATASSGLPVTFTASGPVTISGNTVTLTGQAGPVLITASQGGNATFAAAPSVAQTFSVVVPGDRIVNLSSRVRIAPDPTRSLIAGFVIGGTLPKRVVVRAIGPALTGFGVEGALVNPKLQIFDAAGAVVIENDDWSGADTAAAFTTVSAFALTVGSKDAALVTTLAPGSYTMQITAGTETGIALAEVYDASPNPGAETQRLVNISTRGMVEAGDGVLIGGFVIKGTSPKKMLIRGIGPALGAFGVTGTVADPRLSVFSGQTVIAQNDNWSTPTTVTGGQTAATAAEVTAVSVTVGAFALTAGSLDSAVLVTLPPGSYTAQVAGAGTTTGVALVEIYEVP